MAPIGLKPGNDALGAVQETALRDGFVVCHGRLDDWARAAAGPGAPGLLGADWPRYLATREPAARARLLGSRLLLRRAVAAVSGVAPDRVRLGRDGWGRPVVHEPAGLDAGISHTAGVLVVGVALGRRIGVDVEARHRPLLAPGLAERFCHAEELAELRELPSGERNARLVRLWTLKEAYAKALGVGLAYDFTLLRPRPEPHGEGWVLGRISAEWRLRCDGVERFLVASALGPQRRAQQTSQ
ncbi:4'-phosphopantetheinyl transferase family protein [Streptomyces sp. KR55]|uniref:4'-phosphopantetheinyl transferase family protein n=1 Tax=Streptomyces sp. KR55 TaxID=3457425 RepID=UPI003FD09AA5